MLAAVWRSSALSLQLSEGGTDPNLVHIFKHPQGKIPLGE